MKKNFTFAIFKQILVSTLERTSRVCLDAVITFFFSRIVLRLRLLERAFQVFFGFLCFETKPSANFSLLSAAFVHSESLIESASLCCIELFCVFIASSIACSAIFCFVVLRFFDFNVFSFSFLFLLFFFPFFRFS
jgi:hypothetical protein